MRSWESICGFNFASISFRVREMAYIDILLMLHVGYYMHEVSCNLQAKSMGYQLFLLYPFWTIKLSIIKQSNYQR